MTDIRSAKSRVAKGVVWLDHNFPEWRTNVILPDFDIRSNCNCVIGQVFGDFEAPIAEGHITLDELREFGFDCATRTDWKDYRSSDDYDALQAEWTRVLKDTP
jgi:hypothetical protein